MLLTEDEDFNQENIDYKTTKLQDDEKEIVKVKVDSEEALRLVIELLQRTKLSLNFKKIQDFLKSDGYDITEGQILNIQNKVKANKVEELKITHDEKGHILLMAGSVGDVVYKQVVSNFAKIISSAVRNIDELNDDDKQKIIDILTEYTEILVKRLKTAKQS
ncbi:hypothetical protein [Companilactobacillus sp. FL22-1]|uniref:hypothetical protein n=1 Tax=Companilactobacillus sp. FL22-1 TaxID=3373892 RepID=UPI00375488CA